MPYCYLDNAATTRISPAALAAMTAAYEGAGFANPSSTHGAGDASLRVLEDARRRVAACVHARPREVVFTSGGTEANNQALLTGARYGAECGRRHIVASAIEHPSVLRTLEWLESAEGPFGGNFAVTLVAPDAEGVVSVSAVKAAMREDTCLVSVMHTNNEVGSQAPVRDLCRMARKRGALFHTDAVQAAGHAELDFTRDGFDLMSLSAHKFHGPRGTGALVCSHRLRPAPLMHGGSQERGLRAGTVDVAGACGMAVALEQATSELTQHAAHLEELRAYLASELWRIDGVHILGAHESASRHPGIVGLAIEGVNHEAALVLLDEQGICVSAGTACAAGAVEPSHVLAAMGVAPELAQGFLRVSLDANENSKQDIDSFVAALASTVERLRRRAGERRSPSAENPALGASAGNGEPAPYPGGAR